MFYEALYISKDLNFFLRSTFHSSLFFYTTNERATSGDYNETKFRAEPRITQNIDTKIIFQNYLTPKLIMFHNSL